MTAAHTVYGKDLTPVKNKDYAMTFRAGPSTTSPFKGNTLATPVVAGGRTILGSNDWAIMKLSACIGKLPEFGWFEAAHTNSDGMIGKGLVALGYPADDSRGELALGAGTAVGIEKKTGLIKFTGSAAPGESGGPVLLVENGMIRVAGISVAEKGPGGGPTYLTYTDEHSNLVQNAADVLNSAKTKAILDADKAAFGQPNPAAERSTRPLGRTEPASE